eukprot:TRINITY_DN12059_c0_g1_i2.p1 TRINITY_DN12059_c0_g1~~TRINITY_DN12059_c0_g1_i2.p1  ORF type:complete len:193 (-),score=-11.22 TRINITY_DN12059_c0_g1_i2:355-933(-)
MLKHWKTNLLIPSLIFFIQTKLQAEQKEGKFFYNIGPVNKQPLLSISKRQKLLITNLYNIQLFVCTFHTSNSRYKKVVGSGRMCEYYLLGIYFSQPFLVLFTKKGKLFLIFQHKAEFRQKFCLEVLKIFMNFFKKAQGSLVSSQNEKTNKITQKQYTFIYHQIQTGKISVSKIQHCQKYLKLLTMQQTVFKY